MLCRKYSRTTFVSCVRGLLGLGGLRILLVGKIDRLNLWRFRRARLDFRDLGDISICYERKVVVVDDAPGSIFVYVGEWLDVR